MDDLSLAQSQFSKKLEKHPNLPPVLSDILVIWIMRCDGFLFDTELVDKDDTISYLINKSKGLLGQLTQECTGEDFCDLFAREFEGLYFHSWGKDQHGVSCYWNSTEESYLSFKARIISLPINNYTDRPHVQPELVKQWLMAQY